MNFEYFLARRITFKTHRKVSALVVRLAVLSIAVAIATIEIAFSFVKGFETEIQKKVIGFGSHVQIGNYFRSTESEIVPLPMNEPSILEIRNLSNVVTVSPYVQRFGLLRGKEGQAGVGMKGVAANYDWRFFTLALKEGHIPDFGASENESDEVLISKYLARLLDLKVGDKTRIFFIDEPIKRRPLKVVGIYESGMEEFDKVVVICDLRMLQKVYGWDDNQVSGFEVNLASMAEDCQWVASDTFPFFQQKCTDPIIEAATEINNLTPYLFGAEPITYIYPDIFDWLSLQQQNVWFIMILMIIVAVINMTSVVLILILERTRTVGLLRAIGLSAGRMQRVFVINAAFLIGSGVLVGNILGLGLLASQDIFGWLRVSQESYFIEVVPVAWEWTKFLWVNIGLIAICCICMLLPSMLVFSIKPVKALRFD